MKIFAKDYFNDNFLSACNKQIIKSNKINYLTKLRFISKNKYSLLLFKIKALFR